tara:strand:+ start:449 stop:598 length:150 start_codon:yes stop_codon:yes gene_type:complete
MALTVKPALKKGIEAYEVGLIEDADRLYTYILSPQLQNPDANRITYSIC